MRSPQRRRRSDRSRGAVLVEGALVFPVVFFCFMAIIESGLFFATSSTTNNAARDGARYGASNFATSSDRQVAADQIRNEVVDSLGGLTSYGTPMTLWIYEADPVDRRTRRSDRLHDTLLPLRVGRRNLRVPGRDLGDGRSRVRSMPASGGPIRRTPPSVASTRSAYGSRFGTRPSAV